MMAEYTDRYGNAGQRDVSAAGRYAEGASGAPGGRVRYDVNGERTQGAAGARPYPQGRGANNAQGYGQTQGYGRPQGGAPQGGQRTSCGTAGAAGAGAGAANRGQYGRPQGQYPQAQGRGANNAQGYGQGQPRPQGGPRPQGQGAQPQAYGQARAQGRPQGQYPQGQGAPSRQGQGAPAGAYNRNAAGYRAGAAGAAGAGAAGAGARLTGVGNNARAAGYAPGQNPRAGYAPGQNPRAAQAQGQAAAARSRGNAATNVQLMDASGRARYGAASGNYKKEYGNTRPKVFRIVLIAVLALVLGGVAFGAVKVVGILSNLYNSDRLDKEQQEQLDNMLAEGKATEPFYMLLLGTDASAWRESIGYDNQLSDSMILARVDAPNKKVTLISLLRDTWIDTSQWSEEVWSLVDPKYLPYIGAEIKLNSANKYGGPALLVACVTQLTGLPITHYAEINMDGFISLVDAVGGIEVNIPTDLYDPQLGVTFTAGWQTLDGDRALDLCRIRYAYEQGNTAYGHGGDVYRAANQRMVISALLKKILASDMSTLIASVTELSKYVLIDKGLGVTDLAKLAVAFRGLDSAKDIYSTRIPAAGGYVDQDRWAIMVARMNQGLSPVTEDVIDPESGTILQSAGTGDITDLSEIDKTYTQPEPTEGEQQEAA